MNPKVALSGNNTNKPSQEGTLTPVVNVMKPEKLLELSIKQKEQLKTYFPDQVNTYPLPINYII
jgi:hypothetical protein